MPENTPPESSGTADLNHRIEQLEAGMRLLKQELQQIRENSAYPARFKSQAEQKPASSAGPLDSGQIIGTGDGSLSPGLPAQPVRSHLHGSPPPLPWKPAPKEAVSGQGSPKGTDWKGTTLKGTNLKGTDLSEWFTTENLINKVGIGLLLFGVAFLFKYSIDQGWLIPEIRLSFGLLLGILLLIGGNRTYHNRRTFSLALLGGAIATFYITGFASYQIFELTSRPVTFTFMIAVTLLAFFLSLRQKDAVLSVIGTLGGLMTPFILTSSTVSLTWLVIYTSVIIGGTSAIYYIKGWRSVLWVTVVTGSFVYLLGNDMTSFTAMNATVADKWFLQSGILLSWALLGIMPVFREHIRIVSYHKTGAPGRSATHEDLPGSTSGNMSGSTSGSASGNLAARTEGHLLLLTVLMPLITLGLSALFWNMQAETWGLIFFGAAAVYGVLAIALYGPDEENSLWYIHFLTAILLFTIGILLVVKGHWLFFLLAAEALVLYLAGDRFKYESLKNAAHALMMVTALWMIVRLADQVGDLVFINPKALTDLGVIAIAVLLAWRINNVSLSSVYWFAVHAAFMMLVYRELAVLEHGLAFISLAWGIYAIGILVAGLQMRNTFVSQTGMGTLLIVVAKLFLVDLAAVDALWRILLFLGFGGILLLLSYFFSPLWRKTGSGQSTS